MAEDASGASASSRQLDTLRLFGALTDQRDDWGGSLVLCCGEGCANSGIPAAVSIAGGATLAIEADAAALKSAMRSGELDFVVNTLDEALRALKNQVRQSRPLGVGLIANVSAVLEEMVERGVLPNLLLIGMNQPSQPIIENNSIQALQAFGMRLHIVEIEPRKNRHEVYLPAASAIRLREIDEELLAILPADDVVRRRWIQRVPKYRHDARSGGRWIWLSDDEQAQMGE